MKRRQFRLKPDHPNHIVCRGNNRRRLFSYPQDYQRYLGLLHRWSRKFECDVNGLCLMTNHVHLVLRAKAVAAISEMMKRVNHRYSQIRNETYASTGKLFEQRFWSAPIEDEQHLAYTILYVNANPHKAQLRTAERYRWSSYAFHMGLEDSEKLSGMLTMDPWYRRLGRTSSERASEYRKLHEDYLAGRLDNGFVERALIQQTRAMEVGATVHVPRRPDGSVAREEDAVSLLYRGDEGADADAPRSVRRFDSEE